MLTTFAVAMVSSKPHLSDEIEVDTITEGVNGNAMVHEIRKRSPLLIPEDPFLVGGILKKAVKFKVKVNPIAQFNSMYWQCAYGTKIGLQTFKVLLGPLSKAYVALLPVVAPPVGKLFLAGICPKLSLPG